MNCDIVVTFSDGLILGGGNCLHATSQKCSFAHMPLQWLSSHSEVSYRLSAENDNVTL